MAWRLGGGDPTAAPTQAVFHADGTYIQVQGTAVGVGSWEPTGPNTGDMTFAQYMADDTGAFGVATVRATVTVAADDGNLTAVFTVEYVGPDGAATGQMGPGAGSGTRIAVEPMGSPVAPLGPPASAAP